MKKLVPSSANLRPKTFVPLKPLLYFCLAPAKTTASKETLADLKVANPSKDVCVAASDTNSYVCRSVQIVSLYGSDLSYMTVT